MVWFKVDDVLADHPKVIMAGNAAMGLWVRAGAWSMKHLTDGFIPEPVVPLLGTAKEAQSLVSVGLWLEAEGGYRFHAWDGRQPSKVEVEDRRRHRAEAGRKGGVNSGQSRREAKAQATVEANASLGVEANANPVPSRPVPELDTLYLPADSLDPAARDFQPEDLIDLRRALAKLLGEMPDDLTAATVTTMLLETSPRPVVNIIGYVRRCVERSPVKVRKLCDEAARQSANVRAEIDGRVA